MLNEADTRAKLIDPAIHQRGWSEDMICREVTQGAIEIVAGRARRRYCQDAAIRAVFERVARCAVTGKPPRTLLSLATGTGKTFIACHLLKRMSDAGQMHRALFVCDRDELRTQGLKDMQAVFGA